MIEDKAGWGLVPGLQAPLLHTHSAQRAAAAAPWQLLLLLGWAGPGWAGCAGCAGLPCTHRLPRSRPAALRRAAGAQPRSASEPQALGTQEPIFKWTQVHWWHLDNIQLFMR
ncbi:guanine nucleotide-binding protein G(I)/G(S)/G(O) subunit gamma-2 isoform X1 [Panthera leo]|uniref:guanine nucleotide-binding protein G(I)/G(S)/G(O) subunit gamma-2 isoform X1 n=1 Tax=Panthera leo TaxID=9689 RepID=UPI001C6A47EE|nr:guanine nucleotide-binding protein G(I)/G(S)/G(O) subunit gamma-2 isoform X1 [Panthera leo]